MAPPPPPPPPGPSGQTEFVYWNAGPGVPFFQGYFGEVVSGDYFPPTPSVPGFLTDPFFQSSFGPSPLQQEVGAGGNIIYDGFGYFGDAGLFDWNFRGGFPTPGVTTLSVIATGLFVQISLYTPHAANIHDNSFWGVAAADISILSEGEGFAYLAAMPFPGSYIDEGGYGTVHPVIVVTPPFSLVHGPRVYRSTAIVTP